jgi:hypothetical protein
MGEMDTTTSWSLSGLTILSRPRSLRRSPAKSRRKTRVRSGMMTKLLERVGFHVRP